VRDNTIVNDIMNVQRQYIIATVANALVNAVVTVPAYFNNSRCKDAGTISGLNVSRDFAEILVDSERGIYNLRGPSHLNCLSISCLEKSYSLCLPQKQSVSISVQLTRELSRAG
jgi:hypothetical protein